MTSKALGIVGLALLFVASACAGTSRGKWVEGWFVQDVEIEGPSGKERFAVAYRAGQLEGGWKPASAPPGDFAFYNSSQGATVYADSSCGKRYEDAPLTVLANHLLFGFSDLQTESQVEIELSGRAGLERVAQGRMDGVPVRVQLTVIKKGPCVFDMALITSQERFETAKNDYQQFRDAFAAEIRN